MCLLLQAGLWTVQNQHCWKRSVCNKTCLLIKTTGCLDLPFHSTWIGFSRSNRHGMCFLSQVISLCLTFSSHLLPLSFCSPVFHQLTSPCVFSLTCCQFDLLCSCCLCACSSCFSALVPQASSWFILHLVLYFFCFCQFCCPPQGFSWIQLRIGSLPFVTYSCLPGSLAFVFSILITITQIGILTVVLEL